MANLANSGSSLPISEQDAQKVLTYNGAFTDSDAVNLGYLSKSVAGAANVTLTREEALTKFLKLTGALTGNISVSIPATGGFGRTYLIWNSTSGAFTLGIKVGS